MAGKGELLVKGDAKITNRGRKSKLRELSSKVTQIDLSELLPCAQPDELSLGRV
jgi:hypothetical protein